MVRTVLAAVDSTGPGHRRGRSTAAHRRRTLDGPGNFYPPTVLTDIPEGSPVHREEFFGRSLLWQVRDLDDAIRIANDPT